jgi:putative ABC transport system substrate-binding protein
MSGIRRRELITVLGGMLGGAAAWPVSTRAQQTAMPVIGFLLTGSFTGTAQQRRAFQEGLNQTGFIEGRNVAIEYRWADGRFDRLAALATDLAHRQVKVIATAGSTDSALAAKAATAAIPIVFSSAADPVVAGLVASLNRPSGNLTGVTSLTVDLVPKRLELLHEAVPTATTIGVLLNSANRGTVSGDLQSAADALGLQLRVAYANGELDLEAAFVMLEQARTVRLSSHLTHCSLIDERSLAR